MDELLPQVDEAVVKAQALKHVAGTWAVEENKVKSYRLSYFNSRGLAEVRFDVQYQQGPSVALPMRDCTRAGHSVPFCPERYPLRGQTLQRTRRQQHQQAICASAYVAGIGHWNARRRQVYEDIRSDSKAWVSPDFETDKAAGRFPFGRLPLLEVSCALCRG